MSSRIMIVDDDPGMQDAFRLIFERAGYQTTVLAGANSILDGSADIPDLYVLDKQLSGVDGLDVCRFLKGREQTKDVPIIIVSATPHVARMAEAACADAFLEKPFRQKELLAIVAGHMPAVA